MTISAALIQCHFCHNRYPPGTKTCPTCGGELPKSHRIDGPHPARNRSYSPLVKRGDIFWGIPIDEYYLQFLEALQQVTVSHRINSEQAIWNHDSNNWEIDIRYHPVQRRLVAKFYCPYSGILSNWRIKLLVDNELIEDKCQENVHVGGKSGHNFWSETTFDNVDLADIADVEIELLRP